MKVFLILSAVAIVAYLLVKRSATGVPIGAPIAVDVNGIPITGTGSGIVNAECAVFNKFGFPTGSYCQPGSRANTQIKQAYSQAFTVKGAKRIGGVTVNEIRTVSQPWKVLSGGFNTGPNRAGKTWKG